MDSMSLRWRHAAVNWAKPEERRLSIPQVLPVENTAQVQGRHRIVATAATRAFHPDPCITTHL